MTWAHRARLDPGRRRFRHPSQGEAPMKRSIATPLMAMALVTTLGVAAQPQEAGTIIVRDRSGASVGRIDADGIFRNRSGAPIGGFQQGVVRDRSGAPVGRIDADGRIRNRSGALIGRVDPSGTLRDRAGARVGRINVDGTVRDRSGSSSGRFQGYEPAHRFGAAAYLFFFNPLHRR